MLLSASLLVGSALWLAALVLAPYSLTHLPPSAFAYRLAVVAYAVGGSVCHQQPTRSFHGWGVQLPVCARCTGLYAGGMLGIAVALVALGRRRQLGSEGPDRWEIRTWRAALAAAAVPTLATFALEWSAVAPVSRLARAIAAVPLGLAAGWVIAMASVGPWTELLHVLGKAGTAGNERR